MSMAPYESLKLTKIIARASLDRGSITLEKYNSIMKQLNELEEEQKYEEKLKDYRVQEAKKQYSKKLTTV